MPDLTPSEKLASATCSTCRFWTPDADWYGYELRLTLKPGEDHGTHAERQEEARRLFRTCKRILICDEYDAVDAVPAAYTIDGSGYRADLKTRPDFGCVLHEPAEEPS